MKLPDPRPLLFFSSSASSFAGLATTLAGLALAGGLSAAEYPSRIDALGAGCDSVEITKESASHATVIYTNCLHQGPVGPSGNSVNGTFHISDGGIKVAVGVAVNADGANECATVTPTPPFVAIPGGQSWV